MNKWISFAITVVVATSGVPTPTTTQVITSRTLQISYQAPPTANVSLQSFQTTGSMAAGSHVLTLTSNPGFQNGDPIIVATGAETVTAAVSPYTCTGAGTNSRGNAGARGSVGVGGVWPQQCYTTVAVMNANTPAVNTYAWVVTDATNGSGSVYQYGPPWVNQGTVSNANYYISKAIPKALVTTIVSGGGTASLTLTQASSVAVSNANVYYDNAPLLNGMWSPPTANHTYTFPSGSYAIGSEVDLIQSCGTPPCEPNVVVQGQGGYPTCSTTLFSPQGAPSVFIYANEDGTNSGNGLKFQNFCMTGNSRLTGYAYNWNAVSQTDVSYSNGAAWGGIVTRPSAYASVSNMTFHNTWAACYSGISDGFTCANVQLTEDDPILVEIWPFECADTDVGCTFTNISLTSNSGLTPGFECFRNYNCVYNNVTTTNGLFSMNDAGSWKIQSPRVTITANSITSFFTINSQIFTIDANIGFEHTAPGGQINNASITIQGYVDTSNNDLIGINVSDVNVPNIKIDADGSASTYSAPNCGSGAAVGPIAVNSNASAPATIVNNMTANGTACGGQANFQFSPGVGDQCNSCVGTVNGLP